MEYLKRNSEKNVLRSIASKRSAGQDILLSRDESRILHAAILRALLTEGAFSVFHLFVQEVLDEFDLNDEYDLQDVEMSKAIAQGVQYLSDAEVSRIVLSPSALHHLWEAYHQR